MSPQPAVRTLSRELAGKLDELSPEDWRELAEWLADNTRQTAANLSIVIHRRSEPCPEATGLVRIHREPFVAAGEPTP